MLFLSLTCVEDFKQLIINVILFRVKKERDEIKNDLSESISDVSNGGNSFIYRHNCEVAYSLYAILFSLFLLRRMVFTDEQVRGGLGKTRVKLQT